jgi:hypothetical protein
MASHRHVATMRSITTGLHLRAGISTLSISVLVQRSIVFNQRILGQRVPFTARADATVPEEPLVGLESGSIEQTLRDSTPVSPVMQGNAQIDSTLSDINIAISKDESCHNYT